VPSRSTASIRPRPVRSSPRTGTDVNTWRSALRCPGARQWRSSVDGVPRAGPVFHGNIGTSGGLGDPPLPGFSGWVSWVFPTWPPCCRVESSIGNRRPCTSTGCVRHGNRTIFLEVLRTAPSRIRSPPVAEANFRRAEQCLGNTRPCSMPGCEQLVRTSFAAWVLASLDEALQPSASPLQSRVRGAIAKQRKSLLPSANQLARYQAPSATAASMSAEAAAKREMRIICLAPSGNFVGQAGDLPCREGVRRQGGILVRESVFLRSADLQAPGPVHQLRFSRSGPGYASSCRRAGFGALFPAHIAGAATSLTISSRFRAEAGIAEKARQRPLFIVAQDPHAVEPVGQAEACAWRDPPRLVFDILNRANSSSSLASAPSE